MCSKMSEPVHARGVLSPDELAEGVRSLSGWSVEDGKLVKPYTFPDFVSAVGFVDRLTAVAEAHNHHPDLFVGWGKVTVQLSSHDVGGITARDLRLAAALDQL
jgi:4a-hydroxytetrahydrobiopterin dehydratase